MPLEKGKISSELNIVMKSRLRQCTLFLGMYLLLSWNSILESLNILVCLLIETDGLNRYGPHRLKCLSAWPIGSDTIMGWGLVGISIPYVGGSESLCGWVLGSHVLKLLPVWHTVS